MTPTVNKDRTTMDPDKLKTSGQGRFPELDKHFDAAEVEARCQDLWEKSGIFKYNPDPQSPTYSIDTPPPYVSAAHLHVGHAMSYTQAEILVRYKRMRGFNIFYPMGFDDNGLPTERYVEELHKVNKKKISRKDFRQLCIQETQKGAATYEKLWRALGLSVDWGLRYSTIDDLSRRTAQKSFIDLYNRGRIYRANEPVLWDTHFETALAQADLETIQRKGKLYDIRFQAPDGQPLVISTTRPELIPACAALFYNPEDNRYTALDGKNARVPLFDYEVPILSSKEVDLEFGTGLMMVCTFGDGEDVAKWKEFKLETRVCIQPDGRMGDLAGPYKGLNVNEARKRIVKDLKESEFVLGEKTVDQNVSVGERSGQPVEFIMAPQWFIRILDCKDKFLKRADELEWYPEWMKVRLLHWIEGLKYDWNISRQRFYGVPFPIWYVKETGEVIIAEEKDLPVDPMEGKPPAWAEKKFDGMTLVPEADVMETWMTSSLTPLINANWAGAENQKGTMDIYPMDLRVQAFEIIRTWLFYTLIKSHFHTETLPWKNVMISGWGLNEQGKKISKKDLDRFTDASGFNRYDPYSLIKKYGADALRYWAANSHLGKDLRFHEREVKDGRKIVVKIWNVARLSFMYLDDFDPKAGRPAFKDRTLEDRWLLIELNRVVEKMTAGLEHYDYATAKEALNKFFWTVYCDDYLEIIKPRFWDDSVWTEGERLSAQATLYESLRILLGLFAPFLPFVTEEIYHKTNRFEEDYPSLHISPWPSVDETILVEQVEGDMNIILGVMKTVRSLRSARDIGQSGMLKKLVLDVSSASADTSEKITKLEKSLIGAARAKHLELGRAENPTEIDGLAVDIERMPESGN